MRKVPAILGYPSEKGSIPAPFTTTSTITEAAQAGAFAQNRCALRKIIHTTDSY